MRNGHRRGFWNERDEKQKRIREVPEEMREEREREEKCKGGGKL